MMWMSATLRVALILVLAAPCSTAGPSFDGAGPLKVGWRDEVLPFVGSQTITNRVYYPALQNGQATAADLQSGPYPLVALIHGAGQSPDTYDVLSSHVASYGYVVASVGGMTFGTETLNNMANETKELIDWVVAESAAPGSPYSGLVGSGGRAIVGHSRGGTATQFVLGLEPDLRAAVVLEPAYTGNFTALSNLAAWDGSMMLVAGEKDFINPPAEVKQIASASTGANRRIYVEMLGAGHFGPFDSDVPGAGGGTLPAATQLALHSALVVGFLEAEMRGDEDAYHASIGGGAAADPLIHEATCRSPVLWVVEETASPKSVSFGVAGSPGDLALIAVAPQAGLTPTSYGDFLLDVNSTVVIAAVVLDSSGTLEVVVPVPVSASGLVFHAQGIVLNAGGALTRSDVVTVP